MEIPPDGPPSVTDLRSPPPSRARRRLVQSTLFPHTPLDDTCTTAQDCQKDEHDKIMTQLNPKPTPRSSAPSEVFLCVLFLYSRNFNFFIGGGVV